MKNIINSLLKLVGLRKKEVGNTLTLTILAEDIRTTCYTDSKECAITKALARAGRADLKDTGREIVYKGDYETDFIDYSNDTYRALVKKVVGMYYHDEKLKDFTHTLVF